MPRGGDRPDSGRLSHAAGSSPRVRVLRPYRVNARIDAAALAGLRAYWRSRRSIDPRVTVSDCINEMCRSAGAVKIGVGARRPSF